MSRPAPSWLRRLAGDREGAAAVILAASAFVLVGAAAVAVDVGSLYLQHRQMQGLADAVALAAANGTSPGDSRARALALIAQSQVRGVTLGSITSGHYVADPSVPPDSRFTTGAAGPNEAGAVRVELQQTVPLYFGAILTGRMQSQVSTTATAARLDMASFSIGTQLSTLNGAMPSAFLSALAGAQLNLSSTDIATLQNSRIDLLSLGDVLRVGAGTPGATYGQVFSGSVPLGTLLAAMAATAPDSASRTLLQTVAGQVSSGAVTLTDLIDLGPLARIDYRDPSNSVATDAYTLLRSLLQLARGPIYDVSMTTPLAGFSSVNLRVVGGPQPVHSPMMTVSAANGVTISTSQTRIYIDAQLATPVIPLVTLRFPLYLEVARATAQMTAIRCNSDPVNDGVTLSVTPSIGNFAIAAIDPTKMTDFTARPTIGPGTLVQIPTLSVTGYSAIALGGASAQSVHFSRSDIANWVTHSVSTNDLVTGIASSLVSAMQVTVTSPLGSLGLQSLTPTQVQSALAAVAPALDGLLNDLTQSLGVPLGVANTRVDRMRCGVPAVV